MSYLDKIWNYDDTDFRKLFPSVPKKSSISTYRMLAIEKFLPLFNDVDRFIVSKSNFESRAHLNNFYDIFRELQLKFNLKQIWSFEKRRIRDILIYCKKNYFTRYDVTGNIHRDKINLARIFSNYSMLGPRATLYVSNDMFSFILMKYKTLEEGIFHLNVIMNLPSELESHTLDPFSVTCLAGPESFMFFKIDDKRILLIGEEHVDHIPLNDIANIYQIHKWLYDLINNLTEQTDMLLEISPFMYESLKDSNVLEHYNSDLKDMSCPLNTIRRMFSSFNYDNFIMHPVDLRDLIHDHNKNPFMYAFENKQEFEDLIDCKFIKNNRSQIVKYFIGYTVDKRHRDIFYKFIEILFKRQTLIPDYKLEVEKYIGTFFQIISSFIESIVDFDVNRFYESYWAVIESTFIYDDIIDVLFMCQMDMFCILKQLKLLETSKNIIIYAGDDHITNYYNFIKIYFQKEHEIIKRTSNQHIIFDTPFDFLSV